MSFGRCAGQHPIRPVTRRRPTWQPHYDDVRAGVDFHPRRGRPGPPAGAAPARAHRLLLPDARLGVRGRGRRAGHDGPRLARPRPLRGSLGAAVVALPDRHQRLPRHAHGRQRRARPMDLGPARGRSSAASGRAARGDVDRADPRRARASPRRRPGRGRRWPGDDPARVRRRAPAPAAPPARRADPVRGAPLEGERGRGAAGHERRLGEQRASAGAGDARRERRRRRRRRAARSTSRARSCSPATSRRSSATTWRR